MTQKDWQRRDAHTLGVFLNGARSPSARLTGEVVEDDSFLLLFNAYGESITFTLPTRRFGARWQVELCDRGTARARGAARLARERRVTFSGDARSCCCGVPDFRCTYRLQLTEPFGFRAARELAVPYIAELGASHLYLSPSLQARHGSTHGYDVVDPTSISKTSAARPSSARSAAPPAKPASASCSTSSRTTWRPPTREPVLAGPRPAREVLRLGPCVGLVPPLLRHRRARRRSRRGPRGVRGHAREGRSSSCASASSTACASTIPTGWRIRASTSTGCASAARARLGREDPRAGRAPARLAGRRNDRLRVCKRRHRALRRSGGRGAADGALCGAHRREALVRRRGG